MFTGALEPVISAEIMQIHYTKHHNAYVTNLNLAMTKLEELTHKGDVSGVIAQQAAIKFNGSIYYFIKIMKSTIIIFHMYRWRSFESFYFLEKFDPSQ